MKGPVLLIEDDMDLRASLAQTLELEGLEVIPTVNFLQARRSIRSNFAGVILSDIRMPGQDGIATTKAITADEDLAGRGRGLWVVGGDEDVGVSAEERVHPPSLGRPTGAPPGSLGGSPVKGRYS